ncbi:MAG: sulfatase [Saprospiraceae bacterium]|nr:sulfatase [Saprospiraceae bacterium]
MKIIQLFICAILWITGNSQPSSSTPPNVILIVADDHGKDALGCYGNGVIKTPNLDRLAATGTRLDRAFCTTASCSASRSVILTGLHNHLNGQYGHQHSYHHFSSFPDIKSLPVLLEEHGYRTGHVGKYHVAPESVYRFQHRFKANARSPIEMAEVSRDFIMEGQPDPFFLYFCFSDPHRGGGWAEELDHQPNRFGNIPAGYPKVEEVTYHPDEVVVPAFLPNNAETRSEIAQYYQSISRLDKGVGKLMDYLEESGKLSNTFIMYISDNGMAFPGAKTNLYEAGMQLPCIVKMPNQKKAASTDVLFSWTDIVPTILDVAGVNIADSSFHGISYIPVLQGEHISREAVFASHTFHEITMYYPMRVMRGERYKLIVNLAHGLPYPFASDLYASKTWQSIEKHGLTKLGEKPVSTYIRRPRFELYDLENDPNEVHNLANDPAFAAQLEGMIQKVKEFQTMTNDPWVLKWRYE